MRADFPDEARIELDGRFVELDGILAIQVAELFRLLDFIRADAEEIDGLPAVSVFDVNAEPVFIEEQGPCSCGDEGPVEGDIETDGNERPLADAVMRVHPESHQHSAAYAQRGFRAVGRSPQNGHPHLFMGADGVAPLLALVLLDLPVDGRAPGGQAACFPLCRGGLPAQQEEQEDAQ